MYPPELSLMEQEREFDVDDAMLMCDFEVNDNNTDIMYDVEWYFGDELVETFTIDQMDGNSTDTYLSLSEFEDYSLRDGVSLLMGFCDVV